ncbi:RecE family exodeoxyribonuclease [Leclercia adecarboxylata]|uniref:RecE family exodeoxyribonuclease n=1 Tax=Leclercia adecarboxylata TaxID=83655 RepID=UPI001F3A7B61|nr:RecE family exodeoxyribonuclease [Leclercia adecarboxylata]MCE9979650.1 PD-(D/E)XK nuclease-like domain-containing protein [Leclercia adecarboxylata]
MEFFYLVKATQKSGKPDAVLWLSANTQSRAALQLDVALEDAGIETGRGKDYAKPVRTDFPVFNDLPEECTIDYTWCERYTLADDQRTWNVIPGAAQLAQPDEEGVEGTDTAVVDGVDIETGEIVGDVNSTETVCDAVREFRERELPVLTTVATLPFRQRLLAQYIADKQYFYHVDEEQKKAIQVLELDVDNSYVQNLILAAENVDGFKKAHEPDIWKVVTALKTIFPVDGKRTELSVVIQFFKAWFSTEHIDRGILTREWAAGNRISNVQRTDAGTNADGGYVTDRGEGAHHTLDTLDLEIACALLPMDFNHLEIPGSIHRRAKEIVATKEEPWKSWSKILRSQPGVLAVNRAAIFNLVRIAPENIHLTPVAHLEFVNQTMTAEFNAATELLPLPAAQPEPEIDSQFIDGQLAADRGEFVEGISEPADPKWVKEELTTTSQPQVANLGGGVFSIEGLMNETQPQKDDRSPVTEETTSDVQMEETDPAEGESVNAVPPGESADAADPQTDSLSPAEVLAAAAPELANATAAEVTTEAPEEIPSAPEYPAYFEPGRYEGLPNNVYHAANGISSTQVKDARVSLMYFNARHVAKTIPREGSKVLDMGNLVHALALQPENLDEEFSVEPGIPEGAFTTAATLRAFIDEHNASLPALLSADDIKALLEEHNATLPAQVPMGGSLEETAQSYMTLPAEFQRIEADQKQTAVAMKACIKEYNATLPAPVKTSGSRDALLEQLAIINPDLVAQEAQKPAPLKVSGTKAEMIQAVKSVKPDAVFADELLDAWRENPGDKILVTHQQMETALAIQKALHEHPTAGKLLLHPDRAVETSYFGIDEETGLEIRVRPDLEIDIDGVRVGADLKTISMWNVKQSGLRARLHREIIDRDYHLSAAMYMQTAALDQFFWIFVNKDEGYHWIAIVEASEELIDLGMLEYRQTMNRIANAFDTGVWPAPITEDYTDELNDFDLRRLEALRTQA